MKQDLELENIEKKAWKSFYSQDGLFDIFIGLILLTTAIRTFTDNVWFTFLIFAGILIMVLGKKYITIPRIGMVKFGRTRMIKRIKLMVALLITFIVMLSIWAISALEIYSMSWISSFLVAVIVAVSFSILAYYLDFLRLFFYGLMFAGGEIIWGIYGEPLGPLAALASGSIIMVIGLVILSQFLQKYPLPTPEVGANAA